MLAKKKGRNYIQKKEEGGSDKGEKIICQQKRKEGTIFRRKEETVFGHKGLRESIYAMKKELEQCNQKKIQL